MAIAYVQDTGKQSTSNATSSTTPAFAVNPTVGNHLVALVSSWANATQNAVFTDSDGGNTWATDAEALTPSSGQQAAHIGSAKVAHTSAAFTVTATFPANHYFEWGAVEFSGLASTSWFDQHGSNQVDNTGATSLTVTAGGANSQANMLVVAVIASSSGSPNIHVSDPPTGYTAPNNPGGLVTQNGAATVAFEACYKIVSAGETSAVTWTFDATTGEGASGVLATYKAVAAASDTLFAQVVM